MFRNRWFDRTRFAFFAAPRRPRHPLLRAALGALGVVVLPGLLVVGVFAGLAMLAFGLLWRLWKRRGKPALSGAEGPMAMRGRSIDGDYRVVGKAQLPLAR